MLTKSKKYNPVHYVVEVITSNHRYIEETKSYIFSLSNKNAPKSISDIKNCLKKNFMI